MNERARYRSLFWPILLIGVGIFWLLSNFGYLNINNVYQLWRLWPLLLIVGGLDILIGRRVPAFGAIMGLLVVAVVAVVLFSGFQLPGATGTAKAITERFHAPIDQAKTASLDLNFWSDPVTIKSVKDSTEIMDAQITHVGNVNFDVSGTTTKTIRLSHSSDFSPDFFFSDNRRTDVTLSGAIPLELNLDTGSGSSQMDLTGLNLAGLELHSGSGSVRMTLPASKVNSPAKIDSGSGSVNLTLPTGISVDLSVDSGSGSVQIHLPSDAAVHIDLADKGSGSVNMPSGLTQISGHQGEEGVWESAGYASAANQIKLTLRSGSGSVSISR